MYDAKRLSEVAAQWWADKLRGLPQYDNGMGWVGELATDCAPQQDAPGQIDRFQELLAQRLVSDLAPNGWTHVTVDYEPDVRLQEVASEAGVTCGRFPWKTWMRVSVLDGIAVCCGYGATPERIPVEHAS